MTRFPVWILLGGVALSLGYLPMLAAPFDFTDDGNLVYPAAAGTSLSGHVQLWWAKVQANVEHLGPFRPVVWIHWELAANLTEGNPFFWRLSRLVWCALAACLFLAWLHSLRIPPIAALATGVAAMANPYRNEIWTSLTLAEGVAMPYAMLALFAARRAQRYRLWDGVVVVALLACLGCKNTFVALVPALVWLRVAEEGQPLREGLRRHGLGALLYLLPLLQPLGHFIYFRLTWHAGQYETPGPSFEQALRILSWMKGAAGLDFLAAGLVLALVVIGRDRAALRANPNPETGPAIKTVIGTALLLLGAGMVVYMPVAIMAARYTMPAIWGFDLLVALVFTALGAVPSSRLKWVSLVVVVAGLVALIGANLGRQDKIIARSRMLWDLVHGLEVIAPQHTRVEWVGGDTGARSLNVEEGIHVHWHLLHRGRGDIRIGLVNAQGEPIPRVELPPLDTPAQFRIAGGEPIPGNVEVKTVRQTYRFGRQEYVAHIAACEAGTLRLSR